MRVFRPVLHSVIGNRVISNRSAREMSRADKYQVRDRRATGNLITDYLTTDYH